MEKEENIKKENKKGFIVNYFSNLRNVKKNLDVVRNNPYAYQKFLYYAYRAMIILIGLTITYQLGKLIFFSHSAGSSPMAIVTKAVMVLVLVMIISKLITANKNMKQALLHYEKNPTTIDNYINDNKIDLKKEIDDILTKFPEEDKNKK